MNANEKARAIRLLNLWANEAKAAWGNGKMDKDRSSLYDKVNERFCGFQSALLIMGYEIVLDDVDGFTVLDIVKK